MTPPDLPTRKPSRIEQLGFRVTETVFHPVQDWQRRLMQGKKGQQIVNQKDLRVVGMRRTGNHALLRWIEQQQPGVTRHLNNVAAGKNPYRHKADNLRRYHPEHREMSDAYRKQSKGDFITRDCLISSYEDWSLMQITQPRFERNRELYLGKSAKTMDAIILRDPFNLFASRFKQNFIATKAKKLSMVDMWLEYAREFLRETAYLQPNLICISYNRWFSDQDYRRELADKLDIPFSDEGLSDVPTFGGGSSFDGTRLSGQARAMDVTNRWKTFEENEAFRQCFKDPELWHYSQRIFGDIPGTERLRPKTVTLGRSTVESLSRA